LSTKNPLVVTLTFDPFTQKWVGVIYWPMGHWVIGWKPFWYQRSIWPWPLTLKSWGHVLVMTNLHAKIKIRISDAPQYCLYTAITLQTLRKVVETKFSVTLLFVACIIRGMVSIR
jgi:hypothetical protein